MKVIGILMGIALKKGPSSLTPSLGFSFLVYKMRLITEAICKPGVLACTCMSQLFRRLRQENGLSPGV
jgi:hypothetical protein